MMSGSAGIPSNDPAASVSLGLNRGTSSLHQTESATATARPVRLLCDRSTKRCVSSVMFPLVTARCTSGRMCISVDGEYAAMNNPSAAACAVSVTCSVDGRAASPRATAGGARRRRSNSPSKSLRASGTSRRHARSRAHAATAESKACWPPRANSRPVGLSGGAASSGRDEAHRATAIPLT